MSWNASGRVKMAEGEVDLSGLSYSPPRDQIEDKTQVEEAERIVREMPLGVVRDGTYSVSLSGHSGDIDSFAVTLSGLTPTMMGEESSAN